MLYVFPEPLIAASPERGLRTLSVFARRYSSDTQRMLMSPTGSGGPTCGVVMLTRSAGVSPGAAGASLVSGYLPLGRLIAPNSCFTVGRIRTMIVNTPKIVPKGVKMPFATTSPHQRGQ